MQNGDNAKWNSWDGEGCKLAVKIGDGIKAVEIMY